MRRTAAETGPEKQKPLKLDEFQGFRLYVVAER